MHLKSNVGSESWNTSKIDWLEKYKVLLRSVIPSGQKGAAFPLWVSIVSLTRLVVLHECHHLCLSCMIWAWQTNKLVSSHCMMSSSATTTTMHVHWKTSYVAGFWGGLERNGLIASGKTHTGIFPRKGLVQQLGYFGKTEHSLFKWYSTVSTVQSHSNSSIFPFVMTEEDT